MKVSDFPKIESPFVRKDINGEYIVTNEIAKGYEWVFNDINVKAVEKLNGTNVSIMITDGIITGIWNRTERIPFFNKGKCHIVEGIMEAYKRGYTEFLGDGQHFGECIGEKINGNPHKIKGHLWIPFGWMQEHLSYTSFGKYPKNYESFSEWFKTLMPLYALRTHGKEAIDKNPILGYVEGIVFTHEDGRMAKLRTDMFPFYTGRRHKEVENERDITN